MNCVLSGLGVAFYAYACGLIPIVSVVMYSCGENGSLCACVDSVFRAGDGYVTVVLVGEAVAYI